MIYTTFEQTEYGFVLLDINKKHLDINRFRKYKIERFGLMIRHSVIKEQH